MLHCSCTAVGYRVAVGYRAKVGYRAAVGYCAAVGYRVLVLRSSIARVAASSLEEEGEASDSDVDVEDTPQKKPAKGEVV